MPVDSKVGRRHWGWLILLVTFWKFQHFNLVSKIFQKLFKPLPCHNSIGKMLHAICISAVAVSLRWASCGPWASCFFFAFVFFLCYFEFFLYQLWLKNYLLSFIPNYKKNKTNKHKKQTNKKTKTKQNKKKKNNAKLGIIASAVHTPFDPG